MTVYKFTFDEHGDLGYSGWRPDWMPGADPLTGMGAAHDILEHLGNPDNGAEAEFQATGAGVFVRGLPGWFGSRIGNPDPVANLSSDFIDILERVFDCVQTLNDPGRSRRLADEYAEEMILRVVKEGVDRWVEDRHEGELPSQFPFHSRIELERRIAGWMRIGYRRAVRKYRGMSSNEISYIFTNAMEQIDKLISGAVPGDRMEVSIVLRRQSVECRVISPREEY